MVKLIDNLRRCHDAANFAKPIDINRIHGEVMMVLLEATPRPAAVTASRLT